VQKGKLVATENLIPTASVNAAIRHLGLGLLSVKRIKQLGIEPVYATPSAVYWSLDTPDLIEQKLIQQQDKPASKAASSEVLQLAGMLGEHMHRIEAKLDRLLAAWE
jgi:hypothetical protein